MNKDNIITKEQFCEIIEKVKENEEFYDKLNDVLYEYHKDTYIISDSLSIVLDLLLMIFKDEADWIGYFCWELDFGEKYEDGCITDENGNNIPLKTSEQLYDFLIKNMQK